MDKIYSLVANGATCEAEIDDKDCSRAASVLIRSGDSVERYCSSCYALTRDRNTEPSIADLREFGVITIDGDTGLRRIGE